MAAPIGNKNAVGNNGGKPPYFDADKPEDIERLKNLCEDYFEYIKGEYDEDEEEQEDGSFKVVKETIRNAEPPTVTGLTLHLGFESKTTLYEYAKKVEFQNPIKRALTKIEQFHERAASYGDKCTGNIFILKNFGWRDTTDITTAGEKLPSSNPTIVFKKYDKEDGD